MNPLPKIIWLRVNQLIFSTFPISTAVSIFSFVDFLELLLEFNIITKNKDFLRKQNTIILKKNFNIAIILFSFNMMW